MDKRIFCGLLFINFFEELELVPIWWITQIRLATGALFEHALLVGECLESRLAVISAHTAAADPAERHARIGEVQDGVIDAAAAESTGRSDFFCCGTTVCKMVKGKRVRHGL